MKKSRNGKKIIKFTSTVLFVLILMWIFINLVFNSKLNNIYSGRYVEAIKNSAVIKEQFGEVRDASVVFFSPFKELNNERCLNYRIKSDKGNKNICVIYNFSFVNNQYNKMYPLIYGFIYDNVTFYDLPTFDVEDYKVEINNNLFDKDFKIEFKDTYYFLNEISLLLPKEYNYRNSLFYFDKNSNSYLVKNQKYSLDNTYEGEINIIITENKVVAIWEQ